MIIVMGESACVRLAVGAVLLASLAGCGDRANQTSTPADVVPFERRPAELPAVVPSEEAAAPDVPECTSDVVTFEVVTEAEVLGSAPASATIGPPESRNVALMARPGERCGLSAWPTLHFTASKGRPDILGPRVRAGTVRGTVLGLRRSSQRGG
jgi:hypothetical protein